MFAKRFSGLSSGTQEDEHGVGNQGLSVPRRYEPSHFNVMYVCGFYVCSGNYEQQGFPHFYTNSFSR